MADQNPAPVKSPEELRSTLIKRLAVAGGLVAVLLGVLAFFDYLATPPEEPESPTYTQPVPVPPKKEVTQPVKPAEPSPEAPAEAPKSEAAPPSGPPPAPVVPAEPSLPETRPEAKSAPSAHPVVPRHAAPAAPASPAAAPEPEGTAAPTVAPAVEKTPVTPPPPKPAEVLPPRLVSGYVLQAGVFSDTQRAEELHAKLALNGIPSSLETRVEVGPFKSKAEADAAREKLQGLGIESVLIPPKAKKHRR